MRNKEAAKKLAKGLTGGKGVKRHRGWRLIKDPKACIGNPGLRRAARRAGIRRMTNTSFDAIRNRLVDVFLNDVLTTCLQLVSFKKKKTVSVMDVVFALKRRGMTIYGHGSTV